jgi:type IV secretory pathway VirB10-like protein
MASRRIAMLVVALIPALVLAAPRGKKRPKKTTKPPPEPVEPAPPPEPTPAPTPTVGSGSAPTPPSPAPQTPGTGSGSAEVTKQDPPETKSSGEPDVDTLRQEYLSLRDELFNSRARANTVASQLYSTRIQIKLTYTTGRYYNPAKSQIRLDGASVFENTSGAIATDDGVRFEGYVAPGRHVVTFRVEATGKDDDTFVSTTESSIVVKAVANKDLIVTAKAKDSGDIAYEWKKKEKGSYGLGIDVSVKTAAREGARK